MNCGHCGVAFHTTKVETEVLFDRTPVKAKSNERAKFFVHGNTCPECRKANVSLHSNAVSGSYESTRVFPSRVIDNLSVPKEVPDDIAKDYLEAKAIIAISPRASAALSRRCLQSVLQHEGYADTNLAKQIKAAINEQNVDKVLPLIVRQSLDAIRNFGNFSVHPITAKSSNQIIDVEPSEAEWCLEILEGLFLHFFVNPATNAQRLSNLQQKLELAGKPPMNFPAGSIS